MVVLNHDCEDFCPIRRPQSGDVGFEIVQGKHHMADHATSDITQVRPVYSHRGGVGRHVAVRVIVVGDCVAHAADVIAKPGAGYPRAGGDGF
jgi:hypothetical protein